jgi:hypothetical protein
MSYSSRWTFALLLLVMLASLGCGDAATSTPTAEQAASQAPLPAPDQQSAQGFSTPAVPPPP